jgi:eukaryotic-like serine/threonine-protein kinase
MKISAINRFFNILLGALAMVAVAIISAYLAMRIAIHGREVTVPNLANLTLPDASKKTAALGLRLDVENHFYSATIPAGIVLSQSPAPGAIVRRQWTVRITQSLGPQQVSIPSLTGETERPATITLRRLSLELGSISHLPSTSSPGIVLAQSPTANGSGIDSPRVSLLLSAPEPDTDTDDSPTAAMADPSTAIVMPSLTGLTLSAAVARATSVGLHIVSAEDLNDNYLAPATPIFPNEPPPTISPATVVSQSPPSGHRVIPGDPVHIALGH